MTLALIPILLLACGDRDTDDADDTGTAGTIPTGWEPPGSGVITLETRDLVKLEADYYPAAEEGRPGVVLLHMIPPNNDRTNWTDAFIWDLTGRDWAVLAIDRRGAGGSDGVAEDAYEGEGGRYDVEVAVQRLVDDGYGPIGIMGASNGTTSMVDYAAWASGDGLTVPVVLGLLTGGTYTENQTSMKSVVGLPAVFTYQTSENAWSEQQRSIDPGTWSFHEYLGAGHGTQMLTSDDADDVTRDLATYFEGVFGS